MNKRIARLAWVCAAGLLSLNTVQAQETDQAPSEPAIAGPTVRPLLGMGLTFGGDTLATTFFTDGTQNDIKAGQLVQLYGGLEYRATPLLSIQATVGYHVDNSSASNGNVKFSRIPVELLGHFHASETWQFGGGLRVVNSPKLSSSGAASSIGSVDFDNTTGLVIEGEYRLNSKLGFKLRYVSESYEAKAPFAGSTVDGSHIGLMVNWYL